MNSKYVIHAVGPIYSGGNHNESQLLESAVKNSLELADKKQFKSIAIPAISSGIFGFPKDSCAEIMFRTALNFFAARPQSNLKLVRFTNFDIPTVAVFCQEFDKVCVRLEPLGKDQTETGVEDLRQQHQDQIMHSENKEASRDQTEPHLEKGSTLDQQNQDQIMKNSDNEKASQDQLELRIEGGLDQQNLDQIMENFHEIEKPQDQTEAILIEEIQINSDEKHYQDTCIEEKFGQCNEDQTMINEKSGLVMQDLVKEDN